MFIQSVYDEILEDNTCPECGCAGILPNGVLDWVYPDCGYEGSLEDD